MHIKRKYTALEMAIWTRFEYLSFILIITAWVAIYYFFDLAWIFHTMKRIGRTGENPFERTANDVPISNIARGIEINLRQNLGESLEDIPKQFPTVHHTQF